MNRSILFIVNPISGRKGSKKRIVRELLKSGHSVAFTEYAGHAEILARNAAEDVVVAVGGDGTVNEVARGLLGTDKILGIIPCGSGDGLALCLGISRSFRKAFRTVMEGEAVALDCAEICGRPFFSVCGTGLDAIVSDKFSHSSRRGLLTYIKYAFETWKGFVPETCTISVDDSERTLETVLVTVGNSNQWGNNARITPGAECGDGLLDVTIVRNFKSIEIPILAWRLMTGSIGRSRRVVSMRGRRIRICRTSEGPAHYDGDCFHAGKELSIGLLPRKLRVLKPRD